MSKKTSILPSMFSVSRAIQYSNGIMLAKNSANASSEESRTPVSIPVIRVSARGSISSHGDATKLAVANGKKIKNINAANIQAGDVAFLPAGTDTLLLQFSMNLLPVNTDNQTCNDISFSKKVAAFIGVFRESNGFDEIARLLVWRLANASALWRNRYGTNKRVTIHAGGSNKWEFNADDISTLTPEGFNAPENLVTLFSNTLSGTAPVLMLNISMSVTLGDGQEVFPSQEMVSGSKDKTLYKTGFEGGETAAMHPQKIGAAIRCFDIWHPEYETYGPLPMEPLGYSHQFQNSFRQVATESDLYSHLDRIEEITESVREKGVNPRAFFLMGCLMRGGVFSASSDKEIKEAKE